METGFRKQRFEGSAKGTKVETTNKVMMDTLKLDLALAENKRIHDINQTIDQIRYLIAVESQKEQPDFKYLLSETMKFYLHFPKII